jgi:hypothetical protein
MDLFFQKTVLLPTIYIEKKVILYCCHYSIYSVMSKPNLWQVAKLMDDWFLEENYILSKRVDDLTRQLRAAIVSRDLLTQRLQTFEVELADTENILNTHVDLNFQLQERVQYLEDVIMRNGHFARPMTVREARRALSFSSDSDDSAISIDPDNDNI